MAGSGMRSRIGWALVAAVLSFALPVQSEAQVVVPNAQTDAEGNDGGFEPFNCVAGLPERTHRLCQTAGTLIPGR